MNLGNTALDRLKTSIQNLPGWLLRQSPFVMGQDPVLILEGPDGAVEQMNVVQVPRLDPAQVPSLLLRITTTHTVVAAPFLSIATQKRLREYGVNYVDATGNCRLVVKKPAIVVEITGAIRDPNPRPDRRVQSLKGAAAGRVVRFLCDFKTPLGIRQIASRAGTTPGYVSKLIDILVAEELVTRSKNRGVESVAWAELLNRWCQDYSLLRSNTAATFLEPRGLPAILAKLRETPTPYALTGSLAATRLAPIAEPRLAACFVANAATFATSLKLRQADAGANVILLEPFDAIVFARTWTQDSLHFAAPSQMAADLLTSPGRGPEEAQELLRWMKENQDEWQQG